MVSRFQIEAELQRAIPYGNGHIHDTVLATVATETGEEQFVFQRINKHVFPDPTALMDNFCIVTEHLRTKQETENVLRHVPTRDGQSLIIDARGNCRRATYFIPKTISIDQITSPAQLREASYAFGQLILDMSDLNRELFVPIPGFHNTEKRFEVLEASISADVVNRGRMVVEEIEFSRVHKSLSTVLVGLDLPERIIHNDTKVNNVLFDTSGTKTLCITDLDTVMPGLACYDFGEIVRTSVSDSEEDEIYHKNIRVDLDRYKAIVHGFLKGAGDLLTVKEKESLVIGAEVMTFENGIRFLTDYLQGDVYFKTSHDEHNLVRCRAQFALLSEMERRREEAMQIVRNFSAQ